MAVWPLLLLLVVAACGLVAIQWWRPRPADPFVGLSLTELGAEGWLNRDGPPLPDELRGKVVLVDYWSTDCPSCIREMPELAKVHSRFSGDGLEIIGLTPERGDTLPRLEQFVNNEQIRWPIGYGAGFAFEMMGIQYTPTYVLFDRTGRSVWGGHSLSGVENAIIAALARK